MLTYALENTLDIPMYEYLYQCIKNDIIHQKLKPHEKLPSKRAFAKNQNVSLITIENAYNQLLIEGYIYSIEKKGYFVSVVDYPTPPNTTPIIIQQVEKKEYLVDLKNNSVSPIHFPFSTWSKLTRQVLSSQDEALLKRSPQQGCDILREAIAKHLYAFSGMNVSPSQIVIGAGTEYLYNLVIQLLGRDQIYALENPGHHSISKVYQLNQIQYQYISLDQYGLCVDELLKSHAHIVHISPAHHYPTGITMPIQRRMELLNWANNHQGYIIEDDYDSELRLSGHPIPALQSIDLSEKVIYMNTFTKTLASTIRISYMVLPHHLLELYNKKLSFYACTVSNFEQYTLASFINEHYFDKHITKLRNHYHNKRDAIVKMLEESSLKDMITISKEDAGLHFLITIHTHMSDETLINKLKEEGIHLRAISHYYLKNIPHTSHTFIMNYSSIDLDKLPQAIEILEKILY